METYLNIRSLRLAGELIQVGDEINQPLTEWVKSLGEELNSILSFSVTREGLKLNGRVRETFGSLSRPAQTLLAALRPLRGESEKSDPSLVERAVNQHRIATGERETPWAGTVATGTAIVGDSTSLASNTARMAPRIAARVAPLAAKALGNGVNLLEGAAQLKIGRDELSLASEVGDTEGKVRGALRAIKGSNQLLSASVVTLNLEAFHSVGRAVMHIVKPILGALGIALSLCSLLWNTFILAIGSSFRKELYARLTSPWLNEREQLRAALRYLHQSITLSPLEKFEANHPDAIAKKIREKWHRFERRAGDVGDWVPFQRRVETLLANGTISEMRQFLKEVSKASYLQMVTNALGCISSLLGIGAMVASIVVTGGLSIPFLLALSALLSLLTDWSPLTKGIGSLCWKIRGDRL